VCAASHGYLEEETGAEIAAMRITDEAADEFIRSRKTPFLMTAQELHDWFFSGIEVAALKPVATAPLPVGHGVKGWITVRAPGAGLEHFTDDRLRLLDGLAYRASMAIQKARLYREQQENAHVADALLEFGRTVSRADTQAETYERIVQQTTQVLGLPEASVWLQDPETGDMSVRAMWGFRDEHREKALRLRYDAETARRYATAGGPIVFVPAEHPDVETVHDPSDGFVFGIAPFTFDGGRIGFLIAGARSAERFDELTLKMLAGLRDQAKLAIAHHR
jgi:GAF domain-containing protein